MSAAEDFSLNPEQTETLEKLSQFENIYVLRGYAGTGKTTTITRWVEEMRRKPADWPRDRYWPRPNIVLTAPTNKAAGVLREMAKKIRLPVDTSTVHSLLSLKMKWEKDKQVLVADPRGEDHWGEYSHVVIDECSMLDSELMKHILDAQERHSNKLVFMGDPCQLPPIGEKESKSFAASEDTSELVRIMRQSRDNPIPQLGKYLRELILAGGTSYPSKLLSFVDDNYIQFLPARDNESTILDSIEEKHADPDIDVRCVAWTNRTVDTWNNKIRDRLYGEDRDEWVEGELIVTTAPVVDPIEKTVLISTDTLLQIKRPPKQVLHMKVPCWSLVVGVHSILVPLADARKIFAEEKETRRVAAKEDKTKWKNFYEFMESFAWIKPAHALTVHRSQGSTFDDVYCSYTNILQNPRRKESLQCLYVAITRPRKNLFLI